MERAWQILFPTGEDDHVDVIAFAERDEVGCDLVEHICFNRQKINLSQVFVGQTEDIRQTDDRIWLVSFMQYDLGYFDLEQKTLQPLDNPFGTRLSPMS